MNNDCGLYEIETDACGESYERCYAWTTSHQSALALFKASVPDARVARSTLLFRASSKPFITELSDSGFSLIAHSPNVVCDLREQLLAGLVECSTFESLHARLASVLGLTIEPPQQGICNVMRFSPAPEESKDDQANP